MEFNDKAFSIECRTGCSCCSEDNHYRGLFSTREIAEARIASYSKMPLLASQYSSTGNYEIQEHSICIINGIILLANGTWFEKFADDEYPGDDAERLRSNW